MKYEDLDIRQKELYDCKCPPERPCTQKDCDDYKQYFDEIFTGKRELPKRIPVKIIPRKRSGPITFKDKYLIFEKAIFNHILNGLPYASFTEQHTRLSICSNCSNYTNNACKLCGCRIVPNSILSKISWAKEKCPEDRWSSVPGITLDRWFEQWLQSKLHTMTCKLIDLLRRH